MLRELVGPAELSIPMSTRRKKIGRSMAHKGKKRRIDYWRRGNSAKANKSDLHSFRQLQTYGGMLHAGYRTMGISLTRFLYRSANRFFRSASRHIDIPTGQCYSPLPLIYLLYPSGKVKRILRNDPDRLHTKPVHVYLGNRTQRLMLKAINVTFQFSRRAPLMGQ